MSLNPPRGVDGTVIAHDDPALASSSLLVRNINPTEHVVFDENIQANRIKSAAFSRSKGEPDYGMSVDLGQLLENEGLPLTHKVPPGFGAVCLRVGDVRAESMRVGSDPIQGNPYHGQVWDVRDARRSKLHRAVLYWVVPIPGVAIR